MKLGKFVLALGTVFLGLAFGAGFVSCKGDGLEDPVEGDGKTIIAIDISTDPTAKDWTSVGCYTYNSELFGGWPGVTLTKSVQDANIFYADISGKEGNCTVIFNNNGAGAQLADVGGVTFKAGKKYIFKSGSIKEWKDYSETYLNETE